MTPVVRKATLDDLPTLLAFEQELIVAERLFDPTIKEDPVRYYDIAELITSSESEVYLIEIDEVIVASGYAKIKTDRHYLKHDKQGYLGFMYVSEAHRGKQFNSLIIDALLAWCQSRHVFEICLDVYQDNSSAVKAYEKVGFKKHMINMRMTIENRDF
ncbi:GNAT family N-acetyltransferase [Changchengzhania lutea]|uniref:GNAT family N-acetyltransferase n=1 Tax=Changchengzhania lutea TaxID=2049305 RepID=UPI00115E7516|nr:GNAT family N-acetyltransferase [Changchengzhania lutea]